MDYLFPTKVWGTTKWKIIEVAIDLFSQNGFSAVSVREITKRVGIKESALYNHFKTKDEILETIYSIFQAQQQQHPFPTREKLAGILKTTTPEIFLMQGWMIFKQTVENPLLIKIWRILNIEQYRDYRARKIILEQIYKGTLDFLECAFELFISNGHIKPYNPRTLAMEYQYPIFTAMTEYLLLSFDKQDTSNLERQISNHIHYFLEHVKL